MAQFAFGTLGIGFFVALIFRNFIMQTLERNTTTAQITHGGIAPVSLRSGTLCIGSLFTQLASKSLLLAGVFGLYLYVYFYLYSDERW